MPNQSAERTGPLSFPEPPTPPTLCPAPNIQLDMFQPNGGRLLVLALLRRIEIESQGGENPDLSASLRARLVCYSYTPV